MGLDCSRNGKAEEEGGCEEFHVVGDWGTGYGEFGSPKSWVRGPWFFQLFAPALSTGSLMRFCIAAHPGDERKVSHTGR